MNICRKITKFIAIRCVLSSSRCTKTRFQLGLRPGLCGGAYDALPDSYSAWEGTPRAEIPIVWVWSGGTHYLYKFNQANFLEIPMVISALGVPSKGRQSKANMSWIFLKIPPGISWKSPGNLLD